MCKYSILLVETMTHENSRVEIFEQIVLLFCE